MTARSGQAGAAVGTIVARNFLPFARVLARSLREHHPELPLFVALADAAHELGAGDEPFEVVPFEALGIPDLPNLRFGYTRQQLVIFAKPYLLSHILNRGYSSALFLDADILVLDRLDPLLAALTSHAIALTPHLLGTLEGETRIDRELNILQSGVYNGGFIGVSARDSARRFLDWFADRLRTHCQHRVAQGMHFDQRFLDLVPAFFDEVALVRDPGCNVAHWNLPERHLRMVDGRAMAGDGPCRFFHFSGFEPESPWTLTRYSTRLSLEDLGPAAVIFDRYVNLLRQNSLGPDPPYPYDAFDNGVPIPAIARQIYLELGSDVERFGDPFAAEGESSFFTWLRQPARDNGSSHQAVSRLWDAVHRSRFDLHRAYPDPHGLDRDAYLTWTATSGVGELEIDHVFTSCAGPFPAST